MYALHLERQVISMDNSSLIIAMLMCNKIGNTKALNFIKEYDFDYESLIKNISVLLCEETLEDFEYYLKRAQKEILSNQNNGIEIITILDDNFPQKLYNTNDPTLYLYYMGDISLLNEKIITVIGTRKASENGITNAKLAGTIFGKKGYVVASGLALGCDMFAHIGCLEVNGKTIAILPSNLIDICPTSNKGLAKEIVDKGGCIVSEYSVGKTINKFNYAKRDRIQSSLADAVLVIEAEEDSGTMIAVKKALNENIQVFMLDYNNISFIKNKINLTNPNDIELLETIICKYYLNSTRKMEKHIQCKLFDYN